MMLKKNTIVLVVAVAIVIAVGYSTLVPREEVKTVEVTVTETAPLELNSPDIKDVGEV